MISVGRYHGSTAAPQYHFLYSYNTFGTAIPQEPRLYRTVLAHDNQSSNAVRTAWTTAFETIGFGLFLYATKQQALESAAHGYDAERIHGQYYAHRRTYCKFSRTYLLNLLTYLFIYLPTNRIRVTYQRITYKLFTVSY